MELIEGSETSAYNNQTPGKYPKNTYKIQNTAKVWNQESIYDISVFTFYWHAIRNAHIPSRGVQKVQISRNLHTFTKFTTFSAYWISSKQLSPSRVIIRLYGHRRADTAGVVRGNTSMSLEASVKFRPSVTFHDSQWFIPIWYDCHTEILYSDRKWGSALTSYPHSALVDMPPRDIYLYI